MNHAVLFHTCLINDFVPSVGFAVVRVLEHLGYTVQVPLAQTCCGQPPFNAGFHDAARAAARHTIGVLDNTDGVIVIPSGSCGDMVIHQYAALLHDDAEAAARAERVASRCTEFSALVAAHLDHLRDATVQARVAYHPSCHLARGLRIDREPRDVIDAIAGTDRVGLDADDECCGFGGVFSVKHADISGRMLERKLNSLAACGAERLVSCDMGCLLHIEGGLHRRGSAIKTQHLAELLTEALS